MIIFEGGGGDYEARDASIVRSALAARASRFRIQVSFLPVWRLPRRLHEDIYRVKLCYLFRKVKGIDDRNELHSLQTVTVLFSNKVD